MWFIVFLILVFGFMFVLAFLRFREERYIRKSTKDAIRPALRHEFESETRSALMRKDKFEKQLTKHRI